MNAILEIRAYFDTVSGAMSYKYFFNGEEQTEEEARKIFGHNIAAKHLSWPLPGNIIVRHNKHNQSNQPSQTTPFKISQTELTNRRISTPATQYNINDTIFPQPTTSPYQPACQECQGESQSTN